METRSGTPATRQGHRSVTPAYPQGGLEGAGGLNARPSVPRPARPPNYQTVGLKGRGRVCRHGYSSPRAMVRPKVDNRQ